LRGRAAVGARQHHHQQEPDPGRSAGGLGPSRRAAHGYDRGNTPGDARGADGGHRRFDRAGAGAARGPRGGRQGRDRLSPALPDDLLLVRERVAAIVEPRTGSYTNSRSSASEQRTKNRTLYFVLCSLLFVRDRDTTPTSAASGRSPTVPARSAEERRAVSGCAGS